jgi:hypothetical protein
MTATQYPLIWLEANWTYQNQWKRTLNFQLITDTVNRVVAQTFALAIQTESMCLYNPLLEVLGHIACDCTQDPTAPPNCYTDGTRVISVGVQQFYAGIADAIQAGSVLITVFDNTVPVTMFYLKVDIAIASASQFRAEQTLSTEVLSNSLSQNPYAIIKNTHKAVVGQLVGDGVVLDFLPSTFNQNSTDGDPSFQLQVPMLVCIQLRSDIPHSSNDFPIPDFATTPNFKTWTPMNANITITSAGYCLNVTQQGNYFPILRVSDWATRQNGPLITSKVVLAFIYIFGIIFVLISFVCAYQMWVALHSTANRLNLGVIIFFFMFMFNIVRGLYLLILPSGRLEDNIVAKYLLSEMPQFLFFSVYSAIIFLWAELSLMIASSHKSMLSHFKWPFFGTNIALYVLFIVVVSTFSSLTPDHQEQLKKAYVFILAGCCLVAVFAFNFFGKKLLTLQIRTSKLKTDNNSTMKRMAITLAVSSVTILAQIAFLFVVTYSTVSPQLALVAYVLTEVVPSATLIYTLRPLSRKLAGHSSSTEMKSVPSASGGSGGSTATTPNGSPSLSRSRTPTQISKAGSQVALVVV